MRIFRNREVESIEELAAVCVRGQRGPFVAYGASYIFEESGLIKNLRRTGVIIGSSHSFGFVNSFEKCV